MEQQSLPCQDVDDDEEVDDDDHGDDHDATDQVHPACRGRGRAMEDQDRPLHLQHHLLTKDLDMMIFM